MRKLLVLMPLPVSTVIVAQLDPNSELLRQAPWYVGGALLVAIAFLRRWIVPGQNLTDLAAAHDRELARQAADHQRELASCSREIEARDQRIASLQAKIDAVEVDYRELVMPAMREAIIRVGGEQRAQAPRDQ